VARGADNGQVSQTAIPMNRIAIKLARNKPDVEYTVMLPFCSMSSRGDNGQVSQAAIPMNRIAIKLARNKPDVEYNVMVPFCSMSSR